MQSGSLSHLRLCLTLYLLSFILISYLNTFYGIFHFPATEAANLHNDSVLVIDATDDAVVPITADSFRLKKSSFSGRMRLLYVVGLENAGHHEISIMLDQCSKQKPAACEVALSLSAKLLSYDSSHKALRGFFNSFDDVKSPEWMSAIHNTLMHMKNRTGTHLYYIGFSTSAANQEIKKSYLFSTYPKFPVRTKAVEIPDVYQIAAMAEQAAIDFRVLILQRDASRILKSIDKTGNTEDPRILSVQAGLLYSQLALLDRKFFYCLQVDILEGNQVPSIKGQLQNFLNPKTISDSVLDDMLSEAGIAKTSKGVHNAKTANSKWEEYFIAQLDSKLSLINGLCDASREL